MKTIKLNATDRAALRWAAKQADAWFGSVTGDIHRELVHLQKMDKVQDALWKLRIKLQGRHQLDARGRRYRA